MRAIILDTFPVSCIGKSRDAHIGETDLCRDWIFSCVAQGNLVYVPEICYYEAIRELERIGATSQIRKLKAFCLAEAYRFIPINSIHIEHAAKLWAQVRNMGKMTSDNKGIDGDMILIAQALSLRIPPSDFVIATTNTDHLEIFAPAEKWTSVAPGI